MRRFRRFRILFGIVLLIFFVQIVAAEDICQIVPDTNYCVIDA